MQYHVESTTGLSGFVIALKTFTVLATAQSLSM